ncbi:acyclic terpene utilization AtuA family protein [Gordonia terrae]|uniref:acyclic terpene utilization AtuA family protein n=1 Tax=Gordonia terrae TaxID=2055 RepID=UPI00200B7FD5|nr:acyclic terpene utilization AtuA family protein [Gordonia terrae]UPW08624.1 acyclic terpene utilization AtuA family protein [Gordonia terrae]
MKHGPIRIANFSGYLGDRPTALDEAIAGDPVDVLIGDYLAEITMAGVSAGFTTDPKALGEFYAKYFLDQLRPHLGTLAERRIKVVVNAGAFNPAGLADAVRTAADGAGVALVVAHVDGDDVLDRLDDLRASGHDLAHLDTHEAFADSGEDPLAANAYLGGWGIATALDAGADIVVCGRVTDASLVLGPAAWWHNWARDAWDALAGAVVAGHVIECGAQAVGGNFSGFTRFPRFLNPGFPIAEIHGDGSSVITKHSTDEGMVTVDTVTAQLVYEIQGPYYLNPDVTVHFESIELDDLGPDRVRIRSVVGSPPPPTTKVSIFRPGGYRIAINTYLTGIEIDAKLELLTQQVETIAKRLEVNDLSVSQLGSPDENPADQNAATVCVRIAAAAPTREALFELNRAFGALGLSSVPGFMGGDTTGPKPRIEYWPGLLPQHALRHRVVLANGDTIAVDQPAATETFTGQPAHPEPTAVGEAVDTQRLPLGRMVYARSGDKGGNSNLGVWTPSPDAWEWLRVTLSTEGFRQMFPEFADLPLIRHEFPHLRAVHFVLPQLLGRGGSSNLRVDSIGKSVSEYVRARLVDIPVELL